LFFFFCIQIRAMSPIRMVGILLQLIGVIIMLYGFVNLIGGIQSTLSDSIGAMRSMASETTSQQTQLNEDQLTLGMKDKVYTYIFYLGLGIVLEVIGLILRSLDDYTSWLSRRGQSDKFREARRMRVGRFLEEW
jgi:hypothetical protein